MCFSLTFPRFLHRCKPCTQTKHKPIGTALGIPLDLCQGFFLRLWASSPRLKPGDLTCLMETMATRTVFPSVSAYTTERLPRPPIVRPACRRFFPHGLRLWIDPDCQRCRLRLLSLLSQDKNLRYPRCMDHPLARFHLQRGGGSARVLPNVVSLRRGCSTQASLRVGSRRLSNADTSCPSPSPGSSGLGRRKRSGASPPIQNMVSKLV